VVIVMVMRVLSLILPLVVALTVQASAREYDIPWFEAHPSERQQMLRECRNDRRVGKSPVCDSAQTAETNAYTRRNLAPNAGFPWVPSQLEIDLMVRSCALPVERQINPAACKRL
jgi:hypothetical protein